ncbi:MAG: hypothetical protein WBY67_23620, partial [Pseudolabrys sp.]
TWLCAISYSPPGRKVLGFSRCTRCVLGGHMKRREFITLLGGVSAASAAWPLMAGAQQDQRVRRIGMLVNGPETDAEVAARVAAFKKGLQDLGWIPGSNLRVDIRFGVDNDDLREKAKELIGLAPDVALAVATPSAMALQRVHPHSSDCIRSGHRSGWLGNRTRSVASWR